MIKRWFFERALNKSDCQKAKAHPQTLNEGKHIGILFDGTLESNRKTIHGFRNILSFDQKNISTLAFINNKNALDNIDYDAYNQLNINWIGIANGEKVQSFIKQHFDVLFLLSNAMLPHFEYIIKCNNADLVIGPNINRAAEYFNFIIDVNQNTDLQTIIDKILVGLEKVSL